MLNSTIAFFKFSFPHGVTLELRGLGGAANGRSRIMSGRFSDLTAMAKNAHGLQQKVYCDGVYFTLNGIMPAAVDIAHREINKVARHASRTAGDKHIISRLLYLVDVDPVRPSGVCSTDQEKVEAFRVTLLLTHDFLLFKCRQEKFQKRLIRERVLA